MAIVDTQVYRQGIGEVKRFTATAPTARAANAQGINEPLAASEIANYRRYVIYAGNLEVMDVAALPETDAATIQDIIFDENVAVDALAPGDYEYYYTTVDTDGLESSPSDSILLVIQSPLEAPLSPTNITTI